MQWEASFFLGGGEKGAKNEKKTDKKCRADIKNGGKRQKKAKQRFENRLKTGTTQSYGHCPEETSTLGFEEWLPGPGSYAQILKHVHKAQPLGYRALTRGFETHTHTQTSE